MLIGRNAEKLRAVEAEIATDGGQASHAACDIRQEDAVRQTVAGIVQRHGAIDALVNNAGGQFFSPLRDISTRGFDAVVRNNLTGGFNMMREVYNRWMADNGGAIVNMIVDMWMGLPNFAHSGAARALLTDLLPERASDELRFVRQAMTPGPGLPVKALAYCFCGF